MAEIKSTLEMVMERAARMTAEVADTPQKDDAERRGMRTAASLLNGESIDLMSYLKEQPSEEQMGVRSGMIRTLLRNIVLPREDSISESSLASLTSIQTLSGNSAEISTICNELEQILNQYGQHREQVKQQLDEAIRNQLKQKLLEQGQSVDDEMSINPAMHPQYQEEFTRMSADLNEQYNQAIEQRRDAIRQRLGG
jgi:hypothetical protein